MKFYILKKIMKFMTSLKSFYFNDACRSSLSLSRRMKKSRKMRLILTYNTRTTMTISYDNSIISTSDHKSANSAIGTIIIFTDFDVEIRNTDARFLQTFVKNKLLHHSDFHRRKSSRRLMLRFSASLWTTSSQKLDRDDSATQENYDDNQTISSISSED